MPFITNYNGAMKILREIENGTCKLRCKTVWMRNLRYALKTQKNPLGLNKKQHKNISEKLKNVSGKNNITQHSKTLKKYTNRKSPPVSASENCNKQMVGNDGKLYISKPNVNPKTPNNCYWKKL